MSEDELEKSFWCEQLWWDIQMAIKEALENEDADRKPLQGIECEVLG